MNFFYKSRSHYHPLCAFELEIQWEIATGSLLAELVMGWSKLANRFNYHIVAAPVDPFATPIVPNSDPLRGPIFIRLNLNSLIDNEKIIFENYIRKKYKLCFDELEKYADALALISNASISSSPQSESLSSSVPISASLESTTNTIVRDMSSDVKLNDNLMRALFEHSSKFEEFVRKKGISSERKELERCGFVAQLFVEFIEYERIIRLQYFQEAILEK
jgi:hypothetical protein